MFKAAAFSLLLVSTPLLVSATHSAGGERATFILGENSRVLDGDTLVWNGDVLKVSGIDAPELGPWAKCWAEAALAGHAKAYVETELSNGSWRIVQEAGSSNGMKLVRVVRADGEDLADLMVVGGYAANTPGHWNWCSENASLHSASEDEPEPRGPSLWWPTGKMYDPRAPN